jgi:hypothetical protein
MRLALSAVSLAALLSSCVNNPVTENGQGGSPAGTGGKVVGTGGKVGTGGTLGTGGTSTTRPPSSVACTDTSTASYKIDQQYGNGIIAVDGNANKNYNFQSNWWNTKVAFANQTETINGLGFTLGNPNGAATADNNPIGFPSIFIGSYQGKTSKGSNLPKQVTALTSVPTVLRINTGIDTANLNASYDVWLTQSGGLVTGSSPGSGGAYLMVWLFKPSKRQPRGTIALDGHSVDGVDGAWTVWYDNTNPPCVSYVSTAPISELSFDLNDFIQDAVENKFGVTASQYLSIVFAGTEVWGGGDGFQIKQFCANVL